MDRGTLMSLPHIPSFLSLITFIVVVVVVVVVVVFVMMCVFRDVLCRDWREIMSEILYKH